MLTSLLDHVAKVVTPELIALATAVSVLMVLASIILTPIVLVNLPADYFHHERPHLWQRLRTSSAGEACLLLIKNLIGSLLFLLGVVLLVLPGQGILTIIVSLILLDFPRKKQVLRRIACQRGVLKSINWLRAKYRRPALEL